jgi:dihydroorotate dehydrogenase (fumarate)
MDLTSKYLGMTLKNPLVVSASPISKEIDNIKKAEDAGAAAIVLYSLFEEQLILEQKEIFYHTTQHNEITPEATSFFPEPSEFKLGPEEYLEHIAKTKSAVNIPVIASLNGKTEGGWTDYAKKMQDAGADAIELNIYNIPTDTMLPSEAIENRYLNILKAVKSAVSIPVALKLSPFFTNMASMAKRFDEAGADALVLFNRFYQPDINLNDLEVVPNLDLSTSADIKIPLRWIAILKDRVKADLAATSGVHTGEDAIKYLMVGANAVMMCSSLLKNGIYHLKTVLDQMQSWMEAKEYESVAQMQGSMSQSKIGNPESFERAQYMRAINNYKFGY